MLKNHDCNVNGHIGKVNKFEHRLEDGDVKEYVSLWGCTACPATSTELWEGFGEYQIKEIDHSDCEDNPCFGCKAKGLQLATGDAAGNIIASGTTQKKWDKELAFYKEARAQGVQPAGTSRAQVQKALEASEVINKPYNASKMPEAKYINTKTAEVMKEVGAI
jgi:hypothetical protein